MGAYICIFALIFLGILGGVNLIMFLGELSYNCDRQIRVAPKSAEDAEYLVREALRKTNGEVIISLSEKSSENEELNRICALLCRENQRVHISQE